MDIDITLLGGFSVAVGGAVVGPTAWRRRPCAGLVKILAVQPHRSLHREQVMDLLWPDVTVSVAAPRLHKAAHFARTALGGGRSLVLAADAVSLFPDDEVRVDVERFRKLVGQARSSGDPQIAGLAADCYAGEFLPQDTYEEWAHPYREQFHAMYLDVLRRAGRWSDLTRADPADEEAHLRLAAAFGRQGRPAAALRQLQLLERALRVEWGIAPSPRVTALRLQLLGAGTGAPRQAPPGGDRVPVTLTG
jgi:DNA-binding SARP family transcriptional activator